MPNLDCEQFKKGAFIFKLKDDLAGNEITIVRNDSLQLEIDKATGRYSKHRITWTGECRYELQLLETTFDFPAHILEIQKSIPLKTEIISCTADHYVFQSKRDGIDFIFTDTLWVKK